MALLPLSYSSLRYPTQPLAVGFNARPTAIDWHDRGEPDLLVAASGGVEGQGVYLYRVAGRDKQGMPVYDPGHFIKHFGPATCVTAWPNGYGSRFDIISAYDGCLWKYPNIGAHDSPWFGDPVRYPLPTEIQNLGQVTKLCIVDVDYDGVLDILLGVVSYKDYFPGKGDGWGACGVGEDAAGTNIAFDEKGEWSGGEIHGHSIWLKNFGTLQHPDFASGGPLIQDGAPIDHHCIPSPVSIEWNHDGIPDLISAESNGQLAQRLSSLEFGLRQLEPASNISLGDSAEFDWTDPVFAAIDIERLHRNDLVVGTREGDVYTVLTSGELDEATMFSAPAPIQALSTAIRLGEAPIPTAVDINGNGILDLLVGKADGTIAVVENTGTNLKPDFLSPVPLKVAGRPYRADPGTSGTILGPVDAGFGYACPEVADWDGDGKFDIVINDFSGQIRVMPNIGTPANPKFSEEIPIQKMGKPLETLWRVRPACVDWNGSGLPDLLALDNYGFLNLYQRDGDYSVKPGRRLLDYLGRPLQLDGSYSNSGRVNLSVCDFDGDGDVDILVGVTQHNQHILNNLFGGAGDLSGNPSVLLLENTGTNDSPVFVPRIVRTLDGPLRFGRYSCSPSAVSWSGASRPDLLVGCDSGHVYLVSGDDWFV